MLRLLKPSTGGINVGVSSYAIERRIRYSIGVKDLVYCEDVLPRFTLIEPSDNEKHAG
jgi:hypothetical protein